MRTLFHIFYACNQDWFTVASVLESVSSEIVNMEPGVKELFLRSDNVGCYHSATLLSSAAVIIARQGLVLKDYSFSEANSGKAVCYRKIAPLKAHIERYISEGKITTLMRYAIKFDIVCPWLQLSIKLQWSVKMENKATVAKGTTLHLTVKSPCPKIQHALRFSPKAAAPDISNTYLLIAYGYWFAGHDVTTAEQLKEAIGCWAAVCELDQAKQMLTPVKWAGISQLNNFQCESGGIKVWPHFMWEQDHGKRLFPCQPSQLRQAPVQTSPGDAGRSHQTAVGGEVLLSENKNTRDPTDLQCFNRQQVQQCASWLGPQGKEVQQVYGHSEELSSRATSCW